MHEKIADKIGGLKRRIETGYPLPGGGKMVDQKAEKELLEIVDWYSNDISSISFPDIKKLIEAFEECKNLSFWNFETKKEIEKVIANLRKKKGFKDYLRRL